MRASRKFAVVLGGVILGVCLVAGRASAQAVFDSPSLADPSLIAAIFNPPKRVKPAEEVFAFSPEDAETGRYEFRLKPRKPPLPRDWEAFDKQYAPTNETSGPTVRLLEKGLYEVNQTLYSLKLFERQVNSLLSLEYSMRELGGYDSRSKQNRLDDFFDHAKVKTEVDWDAPIGLYVGIKFQIPCDSIFQFWK
jgi:hypothetical protein